jgi:hypothetical protein
LCWHDVEWKKLPPSKGVLGVGVGLSLTLPTCLLCGWQSTDPDYEWDDDFQPDYFSPLTPRGELDDARDKCVEKFGVNEYGYALLDATHDKDEMQEWAAAITASPEQICMAIAACIEPYQESK